MIDFECKKCGHVFNEKSFECDYDKHCVSGDEYCDCGGTTYYAACPKCSEDCETFKS